MSGDDLVRELWAATQALDGDTPEDQFDHLWTNVRTNNPDSAEQLTQAWNTAAPPNQRPDNNTSTDTDASFDAMLWTILDRAPDSTTLPDDIHALEGAITATDSVVTATRKSPSFLQRLHAWTDRRHRRIHALRAAHDANTASQCTFRPEIPRKSVAVRSPSGLSLSRLRMETLRIELAERELRECTFHPNILPRSRLLASNSTKSMKTITVLHNNSISSPPTFKPKITSGWRRMHRVRQYCAISAPERLTKPPPFSARRTPPPTESAHTRIDGARIAAFCERQEEALRAKAAKLEAARRAGSLSGGTARSAPSEEFAARQAETCQRKLDTVMALRLELESAWGYQPMVGARSRRLAENSRYRTRITPPSPIPRVTTPHGHARDLAHLRQRTTVPTPATKKEVKKVAVKKKIGHYRGIFGQTEAVRRCQEGALGGAAGAVRRPG